jgi:hypothetical protein
MTNLVTSRLGRASALRHSVLGMAVAAALALPQLAVAAEFDTGNEDLSIRWDNTLRANWVKRASGQDKAFLGNVNYDDGDRNFGNGASFLRLDLLSEFDFVWRKELGFRVSAAGWYDGGYTSLDNHSVATQNHLTAGLPTLGLPRFTERYAKGPSGEFLDAFAFARFNIGDAPVNIKLGQTTVFWGESLLFNGAINSIAYSQNPIDVWKGLSTPGAESKELFRPRVGLNVQSTVTDTLSVAAQYFFNWQSFSNQAWRYPESGSYLSPGDPYVWGADSQIVGPNPGLALNPAGPKYSRLWHNRKADITPDENSNNYGLAVRWTPDWAGGTIGAYYRKTYDMQPQAVATPGLAPSVPKGACVAIGGVSLLPAAAPPTLSGPCIINQKATTVSDLAKYGKIGEYNLAFGDKIDIYALSYSRQIAGISMGAELSYRQNMPLLSEAVQVLPGPLVNPLAGQIATTDVPKHGTPGALGDTMHGLVNLLGVIGKTPVFDTASWATELTWSTWTSVTQNEAVFKGRGNAKPGKWTTYDLIDAPDKNYFGLAVNFTPTWFQVLPGVDFYAPLSWSGGISGNSAVTAGGQDGAGSFGVGVAADIHSKYRFDLKYVGFYGQNSKCPRNANSLPKATFCPADSVDVFNGLNATIADRDFVSLTFKTTF